MSRLAWHCLGIDRHGLADKLKTHRFRNAVVNDKGRQQLEYFIFIQKDLPVPKDAEFFIGRRKRVNRVDILDLDDFCVGIAVERHSEGFDVIKWYFLSYLYLPWNVGDVDALSAYVDRVQQFVLDHFAGDKSNNSVEFVCIVLYEIGRK